jgi:hypothetical protein
MNKFRNDGIAVSLFIQMYENSATEAAVYRHAR